MVWWMIVCEGIESLYLFYRRVEWFADGNDGFLNGTPSSQECVGEIS